MPQRVCQKVMRNDQATDRVVGHNAASVTDDVCVTCAYAQQILYIEACIHARHHGDALGRLNRLPTGIGGLVNRLPL